MDYVEALNALIAAAEAEGDSAHILHCALQDALGCAVDYEAGEAAIEQPTG